MKIKNEKQVSKIKKKDLKDTLSKAKIKSTSEINQKQIAELEKSEVCIFKRKEIQLIKFRETFGDTIKIKNVYDWVSKSKITEVDNELKKVIRRGTKFFQINKTDNFVTIGFIEDEGGYIGVYAYSINKKNCEIIAKELLAETSGWENGYEETFSILEDDFSIRRESNTGSKDWGDYTKWKRDTIITVITFDEKGKMNLEKK